MCTSYVCFLFVSNLNVKTHWVVLTAHLIIFLFCLCILIICAIRKPPVYNTKLIQKANLQVMNLVKWHSARI